MEWHPAQLTQEVTGLIAERLLVEVGSTEDDLLASGVLDSLTLVQLLLDLVHRFGVTIPLEELEIDDFRSVASIVGLIQSRITVAPSGADERQKSQTRHAYATPVLGEGAGRS